MSDTLSTTEWILGTALGDVAPELQQDITTTLVQDHLVGWTTREAATTTEGLATIAAHQTTCPWTTLLVTPWLGGAAPLDQVLIQLKRQWPHLRIAVLLGAPAPEYQPLLTTLAAYQIYNCLIADEFQYDDLVQLVTADWTWDRVQPYLGTPETLGPPLPDILPRQVLLHRTDPTITGPSTVIAVISAQGRSGKTGFIANALWTTADRTSVALDLDVEKPALPVYFQEPNQPYATHLQQLLTALAPTPVAEEASVHERLTPQDKQEVREYLHRAVDIRPGARLVPGPLRSHTMLAHIPAGLVTEMIHQARHLARVVWLDLPASPMHPVWEEALRNVDGLIVLTTPESVAVLETLSLWERLDQLRIPRRIRRLVVNRACKGGLVPQEIAAVHLQHPLWAVIPDQPRQWQAAFAAHKPVAAQHAKWWQRLLATIETLNVDPAIEGDPTAMASQSQGTKKRQPRHRAKVTKQVPTS